MEPILQSIFDSAVDGIIVIDAKGLIKAFNPAAERLFGYSAAEVLDQNVKVLMPSPDFEQHDRYLANYLETGVPRIIGTGREVRGRRKDGSTFPLHLSVGQMEFDGAARVYRHPSRSEPARRDRGGAPQERRARAVDRRIGGRRHYRHRRSRHDSGIQPVRGAAVRLSHQRGARAQREHADAEPRPRAPRWIPSPLPHDGRTEDHRHRPRSHGPPQGRHDVSRPSVGRRDEVATTARAASRAFFTTSATASCSSSG